VENKRGRPRKTEIETSKTPSNDDTKSGLKRSAKEKDKDNPKPVDPKRRERNKTLARESRQRKKEYIESLEGEIDSLKSTVLEVIIFC
jgi:hypothetical protein